MGLVWLGAVLYKMGEARVLYCRPQPNTTTHNNQHEPQSPYPPAALPSLSPWAEQSCPQIILPLLSNKCAQVTSRQAPAHCRWFACLGGQNERHQKIEKGESDLALGGRCFKCLNNNQMGDGDNVRGCIGEEARLGRNVWGGRQPVVWGVELIDEKNREMGGPLALDGRCLMGGHNNQPKVVVNGEGGVREETQPGQKVWGALSHCLGRQMEASNNKI
jgi:hypothetical protein